MPGAIATATSAAFPVSRADRTPSLITACGASWKGRPFCYLEIDSHTAHAGIETRVGAFLDIVEASRRRCAVSAAPVPRRVVPAHLEQDGTGTWVVTGGGQRLSLDDRRVVHVSLGDGQPFVSGIMAGLYASIGWRWVFLPNTTAGNVAVRQAGLLRAGVSSLSLHVWEGGEVPGDASARGGNRISASRPGGSLPERGMARRRACPLRADNPVLTGNP